MREKAIKNINETIATIDTMTKTNAQAYKNETFIFSDATMGVKPKLLWKCMKKSLPVRSAFISPLTTAATTTGATMFTKQEKRR